MPNTTKKITLLILSAAVLASCNGWGVNPLPQPTPFLPPTRTPSIISPTPAGIGAATSTPVIATAVAAPTLTPTFLPTSTNQPSPTVTETPINTFTPTPITNAPALRILLLGCNTDLDILHGMGEVTNAYVTLQNIGNVPLTNLIATLYALDEGREHPDKIQEIAVIPIGYEITLKMTVDSTYKAESPIQVEVNSDQGLFPREGAASCRNLGRFTPKPDGLNTPVPLTP
ncbi:MAG: hypothetical protein HXY42_02050 [Chloroflexi bacterium]|nr:hypothetical protein [Chloroflexota bacterium]